MNIPMPPGAARPSICRCWANASGTARITASAAAVNMDKVRFFIGFLLLITCTRYDASATNVERDHPNSLEVCGSLAVRYAVGVVDVAAGEFELDRGVLDAELAAQQLVDTVEQ